MVTAPSFGPAERPFCSRGEVRHGDAFDLVNELPDCSIDLILTSPPYWGHRSYGLEQRDDVLERWRATGCASSRVPPYDWYRDAGGVLGLEPYPNWYIGHLVEFFNRAKRVLKSSGNIWVNLGDTYFARWASIRDGGRQGYTDGRRRRRTPSGGYLQDKQLLLIPARFAIAMQEAGWILRNDLIWAKPKVLPRPESDRLRLSHEHWLHFVTRQRRGRARYYYDLGKCENGTRDVVICPAGQGSDGHTATFPAELVRPRIVSSCPPTGLLLDPFCGTGRAVVEAVRLERRGLGFEVSAVHAATAQRYLAAVLADEAVGSSSDTAI
jgi:site-specific DNA-methyltransferase (cytosine-N4-specific)